MVSSVHYCRHHLCDWTVFFWQANGCSHVRALSFYPKLTPAFQTCWIGHVILATAGHVKRQTDPSMVTLKVLVDGLGKHQHNHDMSYDMSYDQHFFSGSLVWPKKLIWSRLAKRVASVLGEDRKARFAFPAVRWMS